jgi:hypothetical protein
MIGTATALVPRIWDSIRHRFMEIGAEEKQESIRLAGWIAIVAVLWFALSTTVGVYWPNHVLDAFFFFMLALIIFLIGVALLTRRKKTVKKQLDTKAFLSLGACVFMVFSIACGLLALLGVGATALDIHIGPFERDNYEGGKWCLFEGLSFFAMGLSYFGFRYIGDGIEYLRSFVPTRQNQKRKGKGEEVKDKP